MGPAVLAEAVEPVGCEEAESVGTTDKYEDWPIVVGVSGFKEYPYPGGASTGYPEALRIDPDFDPSMAPALFAKAVNPVGCE